MGRKDKSHLRRKEIIENCYNVIAQHGWENATLKRIGKEMGVAPSLLMHYFSSKEELFHSVFDYMIERMDSTYLEKISPTASSRKRLELFLETNLSFELPNAVADNVFYGALYLSLKDEKLKKSFRKIYDHDRDLISKMVRNLIDEENLEGINPELVAVQIVSFIEGLYLFRVVYGNRPLLHSAISNVRRIIWDMIPESATK